MHGKGISCRDSERFKILRKLDYCTKRLQLRRAHRKFYKKIKRKALLIARNQINEGYITDRALKIVRRIKLVAPKVFELANPKRRKEFLHFIQDLRKWGELGKRIIIDFSKVEILLPCGVILFVAELSRLRELSAKRLDIKAIYPKEPLVDEMLQHLGIIEQLGLKPRRNISHHHVKHWTHWHGTKVDLTGLEKLHQHLTQELGIEKASELFAAMQEAVTNVIHHAYIEPREINQKELTQGWWLFAEHKNNEVYLSICDLGIGIKRTLPIKYPKYKEIIKIISTHLGYRASNDSTHIKAAIEMGNTRTKQQNRGKGLSEMRDVVLKANSGSLRIYSDRGVYYINHKNREHIVEYTNSIRGTIIQWSFDSNYA